MSNRANFVSNNYSIHTANMKHINSFDSIIVGDGLYSSLQNPNLFNTTPKKNNLFIAEEELLKKNYRHGEMRSRYE